jgi:ABC-type multidrug transport system ATPase subunit
MQLGAMPQEAAAPNERARLAELSGVRKRLGKTLALDGVDLHVASGELLALLGPNGAGKTTAISLWLGLRRPDAGTVTLLGGAPRDLASRRAVGVMMQEVVLAPELRVEEHIDLVASYYPNPLTPKEALALTGTTALARRPYGKLSGGQKRQAQFAMAICGRPRLLFLDEPTVGLDHEARRTLWRVVRQLVDGGTGIVLTTHHLEEAEALADRVAVLVRGRLVAVGSIAEIRGSVVRAHITCRTRLSVAEVSAWPGVTAARADQQGLHLTAVNAEAVVRRLLAADRDLDALEVARAGLADVLDTLTPEPS